MLGIGPDKQRLFKSAMSDEWDKWVQFKTTYDLSEKEIARFLSKGHRIVGTRWVLTYKDARRRKPKRDWWSKVARKNVFGSAVTRLLVRMML